MEGEDGGCGQGMQCSDINSRGDEGVIGSLVFFTTGLFSAVENTLDHLKMMFFGKWSILAPRYSDHQ